MKKLLISSIFLVLALQIFGQAIRPEVPLTRDYYLVKSKRQKTAAWTFVGIGTAAIGGGLLIATAHRDDLGSEVAGIYSGALLMVGGMAAELISIPLFIGASKSKKHATDVSTSIQLEELPPVIGFSLGQTTAPSIAVKYRF